MSLQLRVDRDGDAARISSSGYINREGGLQIGKLAQRLAGEGVVSIELDLRGSPLVCVPALEALLQAKRILSDRGVSLSLVGTVPAVAKVLQLMQVAEEVRRTRQ